MKKLNRPEQAPFVPQLVRLRAIPAPPTPREKRNPGLEPEHPRLLGQATTTGSQTGDGAE